MNGIGHLLLFHEGALDVHCMWCGFELAHGVMTLTYIYIFFVNDNAMNHNELLKSSDASMPHTHVSLRWASLLIAFSPNLPRFVSRSSTAENSLILHCISDLFRVSSVDQTEPI